MGKSCKKKAFAAKLDKLVMAEYESLRVCTNCVAHELSVKLMELLVTMARYDETGLGLAKTACTYLADRCQHAAQAQDAEAFEALIYRERQAPGIH